MIDVYKLEGRNIFRKSKLELLKRWALRKLDRTLYICLGILVLKEIAINLYLYLK